MNKTVKIFLNLSVSIAIGLWVSGCKTWEYHVVKQGIQFEKIYQSKSGANIGYMTENRHIQGFPCEKGWIHFKQDWQLLSCQLSQDFLYNSTLLPAHTWIHFPYHDDQTGYVCSFPYDVEVQGYVCGGSGGYKGTHTGFYDSGRLRSFYPPEDVRLNGIPCEASLLVNVQLHEHGALQRCKLAEEYQADGKTYKKGKTLEFDNNGKVK